MAVEFIKIGSDGVEYPIAFNMLTIKRIKEQLGTSNFEQLFTKIQQLQQSSGDASIDEVTDVLEPMGIIAHNGLWTGGMLENKPYTNDLNQTMGMLSSFTECVACLAVFNKQFVAFFSGESTTDEDKGKKKELKNP